MPRGNWPGVGRAAGIAGRARTPLLCGLIFASLFSIYSSTTSALPIWDSYANIFPALSLVNDGNLDVSPTEIPFLFVWRRPPARQRVQIYRWTGMTLGGTESMDDLYRAGKLRPLGPAYYFMTTTPGNKYVGTEPPGAAIAAAPFLYWMTAPDRAANLSNVTPLVQRSRSIPATFIAATAVIMFVASARFLTPVRALLVAAIFGLGTCVWSMGSQALWAQSMMQPFLALGLDQFLRIRERRAHAVIAGLALGCAVTCRSTSLSVLAAVAAFLLVKDRRALVLCAAGALPPIALLAAYNSHYFGSPLTEAHALMAPAFAVGATGSADLWQTPLWLGAAGLLLSPGRGLLVYSPILALAFVGAYRVLRDREPIELVPIVAATAVIMVARFKWFDWWGGFSYGYRPLLDAIVPLCFLLIPAIGTRPHGLAWRGIVALLLAWSVGVQVVGTAYDCQGWDQRMTFQVRAPDGTITDHLDREEADVVARQSGGTVATVGANIGLPRYRGRLWSLRDNPIAYYYAHRAEAIATRDAGFAGLIKGPIEVRRALE